MADAQILGQTTKANLDDAVFGQRFNGGLVHESVRAELNARRQGTASTKTRGEVRGGSAKPWRQKGTGRARAGSSRSPIWTGGGTVFGPSPRHYTFKVNRKERRAALRSALSVHAERGSIAVFDGAALADTPSTKQADALLNDWLGDGRGSVTVVLGDDQERVALSFRNLERVNVLSASGAGVADIIGGASLLVTQEALDALTARGKGEKAEETDEPEAAAKLAAEGEPEAQSEPEPDEEPEA
jgi:large subunit ribosomal protein L4